jgi:pimeloyl-ACP methyl ester carboxylesterase
MSITGNAMPTPRWLKSLLDLVPPVRESRRFRYFDFWRHHPFQPDDRHFRLTNAGRLAEAAMLAYSPPEEALEIFERFGQGRIAVEFIESTERDTSCYLLSNDAFVTVVFRGSEILRPDRWRSLDDVWTNVRSVVLDWWGDAETPPLPVRRGSPRRVHAGFLHDLDGIWPAIGPRLERMRRKRPGRRVWFAGHSLGGALATLAAERYPHTTGIYTFGAPRVGNASFANAFRVPEFRIVNNNDITAWVPPPWPGGFRHVGHEILITASGKLVEGPSVLFELSDLVRGYLWQAKRALGGDVASVAIDSVYDHSPLLYVRRLRQCLIAG